MHGNDTENRAIVHGLNTHVISNDTRNTSHRPQDDVIDAEWEDIDPPYNPHQLPQNNNANLSTAPSQQQERIISDLFNMAGPNETVSFTQTVSLTRKPTVTQQQIPTQHTNRYAYDYEHEESEDSGISEMMFILWILLCTAVVAVIIKVAEFILEHPIAVLLGLIAIACLVGSFFLLKPNRGKKQ